MKDDQEFNIWFVKEMEKYPCLYNFRDPNYNIRVEQEAAWALVAKSASGSVGECKERWKNLRASFTRHLKHVLLEMKIGGKSKKPYYLASHMNFLLPFTKAKSFSEANFKYYGDVLKSHDLSENVIYLDSEEDTNYCEELMHNTETDTLNQEDEIPILNETDSDDAEHEEDTSSQQIFNSIHTKCASQKVRDIAFTSQTSKRTIEDAYSQSAEVKRRRSYEDNPDFDFLKSLLPDAQVKRQRSNEDNADLAFLKSLLPDIETMNGNQKRKFKINVLKLLDEILNSPSPGTS